MPGVPDYRDTPTPTPHRIPRALETGKLDPGWLPAGGGGSVTSAQFQGEVAARISADDALSNAISALALDDLVDVSAPAPADGDALMWNSAQAQWVASAMAGGGGSVTSADFVSLRSDVGRISVALSGAISAIAANSAQMTSADNALSAAINAVSVDLVSLRSDVGRISVALSGAISAIAANSAQMTSADNANSAAAAAVSARLDSTNTVVSNQGSAIVANSAQMTSADNAISAAAAAISVRLNSTNTVVSNQGSAIVANSAQMTSADNAISAAAAAVSVRLNSTNTVVSNQGSAIVANSAQMTSADNAISNRLSTWTLDNLAGVSVPSPTDQQVLVFNSAAGQWLASTLAAGSGSVTSSELSHVASIASAAASNVVSLASDVGRISTLVAAGLVSAGPVRKVLADDQVISSTAPVSISGFTFTISANVQYQVEFGILHRAGVSTAGIKLILSVQGGNVIGQYNNANSPAAGATSLIQASNQTVQYVTVSAPAAARLVWFKGVAWSSVGGTIQMAVGNNVSATGASTVILQSSSYGYVWRMG